MVPRNIRMYVDMMRISWEYTGLWNQHVQSNESTNRHVEYCVDIYVKSQRTQRVGYGHPIPIWPIAYMVLVWFNWYFSCLGYRSVCEWIPLVSQSGKDGKCPDFVCGSYPFFSLWIENSIDEGIEVDMYSEIARIWRITCAKKRRIKKERKWETITLQILYVYVYIYIHTPNIHV